MSEETAKSPAMDKTANLVRLRRRQLWWILPLIVLVVLVAVIYLLSHLSAADSEMYPTTMLQAHWATSGLC